MKEGQILLRQDDVWRFEERRHTGDQRGIRTVAMENG
jgi:hypothetical protein